MGGIYRPSFLFFVATTLYTTLVSCSRRTENQQVLGKQGTNGLEWVDASWQNVSTVGELVQAGHENSTGKPLYVCRASDAAFAEGNTVSGCLSLERAACFVAHQGTAYALTGYYQVLTNPRRRYLRWLSIDEDDMTANHLQDYLRVAVAAAYLRDEESYIYVGRSVDSQQGVHPGYVYHSDKKFHYIEDSKLTHPKEWKNKQEGTQVKQAYKYELLVAETPDNFQLIDRILLTNSNGLTWVETNYTHLHSVKDKIKGGHLGNGKTRSYYCRSVDHNQNSRGALYPGVASEQTGACYVDFEGKPNSSFIYLSRYQVLTNSNKRAITWESHSGGDVGNLKTAVVGGRDSKGLAYYVARRGTTVGRLYAIEGEFQFCDPGDSELYPLVFYYRQHYNDNAHPCQRVDEEYDVMHAHPAKTCDQTTMPPPTTQSSTITSQKPILETTIAGGSTRPKGDDY